MQNKTIKIGDDGPRDYMNTEMPTADQETLALAKTYGDRMRFILSACYSVMWLGQLTERDGTVYLRPGYDIDGGAPGMSSRMWSVSENGGELNVQPVNAPEEMRSVPYTAHGFYVDGGTMAYRVTQAIRGEAIDYDFKFQS